MCAFDWYQNHRPWATLNDLERPKCTFSQKRCVFWRPLHSAQITVRHGSAYTVVRAMNAFNGKCRFSGSCSSESLGPIITKIGTIDYVRDPTPHAKIQTNPVKGGVAAHAWSCRRQASIFFLFLLFLRLMRNAIGPPAGPINAVNDSNDVSPLALHSLYGFDYKKLYLPPFLPQNLKICIAAYGDFERL